MKKFVFYLALSLLILSSGCSRQSTSPESPEPLGYSSAEVPQDIIDMMQNPPALLENNIDPIEMLSQDLSTVRAHFPTTNNTEGNYAVYQLTLLWGDVFGLPQSTATDWSGLLDMHAIGFINVAYEIDFEDGQDYIPPVSTPNQAAWVSQTQMDFDGISFLIYYDMDIFYFVAPTITLDMPLFDLTLYIEQLEQYAAFYPIDGSRGIAIHSRRVWQIDCPKGLITGSWNKDENTGNSGSIEGYWNDQYGNPLGYLSGQFWTNNDGTREYAGSVSGLITDQVIAEFEGTWQYDDYALCPLCGERFGSFDGTFHNLEENYTGKMKGRFGDADTPENPVKMPMIGYWRVDCQYGSTEDANEGIE
ncbi:MAG: hypothetical protein R3F48_14275 [Candidatus Zixiibacteriota bacterium]